MERWTTRRNWCPNTSRWQIIERTMEKWKVGKMVMIVILLF